MHVPSKHVSLSFQHQYASFQPKVSLNTFDSARMPAPNVRQTSQHLVEALDKGLCQEEFLKRLEGRELDAVAPGKGMLRTTTIGNQQLDIYHIPFLLRFPVVSFGMVLGTTSQSVVWLAISTSPAFFGDWGGGAHLIHWIFWCCGLALLVTISITYICKIVYWPGAVRRELHHPFRLSFFFGPLIGIMFLANGTPLEISDRTAELPNRTPVWLAVIVMTLQLIGELYVYRLWFFSEHLSIRNNNPSYQIAVVGNFVGAATLARAGLLRVAKFFWSIGVLFYLLIFISLFQTISRDKRKDEHGRRADIWRFPSTAHPTLFLFIAAPSAAGTSWSAIREFDDVSVFWHSIGLFIFMFMFLNIRILVQTPFAITWWAYTFPIGAISIVTTRYAESDLDDRVLQIFAFILSLFSTFMVFVVFGFTIHRLWSCDWSIDQKTGRVKNEGLFKIDPVIEVCLKDTGDGKAVVKPKEGRASIGSTDKEQKTISLCVPMENKFVADKHRSLGLKEGDLKIEIHHRARADTLSRNTPNIA